ncbi:MarR family winged helix-turn-helix transcriptional regulator [Amycolatopsis sp.]|uniref:MarR family winged helix-turn-helix transcriptional regulator n=1 Tax=Amycolatopsis sp. TaxID=37632 RepID=UPI002BD18C9C|nr:MarR family winged helix-turn-helix transcriptional regulator [Amycolatopsis sp.]HVV09675.1 MarR family winged helix-turn-helix transcriptional regulator [Amycolatopsis sp.]
MPSAAPEEVFSAVELDLADALGVQLVRFMRLITKTKSQVAAAGPDGIERAAYAILFHLIHEGPQRTSRLADALHAEISTISRQSSSLVQHGLVERQADPEDGRACLLAPTAEGLRVFEENRKQRNKWLARMLADWPEEDRQALNELLDRLNTGIETNIPKVADPMSAQGKGADA